MWHQGYYNKNINKGFVTAQLFCMRSNNQDILCLLQTNVDGSNEIKINQLQQKTIINLSCDVVYHWDKHYSAADILPRQKYKEVPVNRDCNVLVEKTDFHHVPLLLEL